MLSGNHLEYCIQAVNGNIEVFFSFVKEYTVNLYCNDELLDSFRAQNASKKAFKISQSGIYQVWFYLDDVECFVSKPIAIRSLNGLNCLDDERQDFYTAFNQVRQQISQYDNDNQDAQNLCDLILKLSLDSITILEYLQNEHITHLAIVTDSLVFRLLLPYFQNSNINIKIFSDDSLQLKTNLYNFDYDVNVLNNVYQLPENYDILFAISPSISSKVDNLTKRMRNRKYYFKKILTYLYTRKYFIAGVLQNNICNKIAFVKIPDISHYGGLPFCYIRMAKKRLQDNKEVFFPSLSEKYGIQKMKDYSSEIINIRNSVRITTLEKTKTTEKKIYLFGGALLFGGAVADNHTIAAFLQQLINDYEVVCYSNFSDAADFSKAIELFQSLEIHEDDIVLFFVDFHRTPEYPYIKHWLNLDAIKQSYDVIDVFPVFIRNSTQELFYCEDSYTSQGNYEVAKEIVDYLKRSNII